MRRPRVVPALAWLAALAGPCALGCSDDDMAIHRIDPASGSARGGETVIVHGTELEEGSTVSFGDDPAASVRWLDAESLEVVTPWHLAATVDVTVVGPTQTLVAPNRFTFEPLELQLIEAATHYLPDLSTVTVDDGAVGDFDLDGDPDVLIAARGTPSRLLRNSGSGAFVDELPLPEELEPTDAINTWVHSTRQMLVEDLDGDDDLDVLLCNRWGQPSRIYQNEGAGDFSLVDDALPEVSDECLGAVLVDLDGDEDRDLVILGRGPIGRGKSYLRIYERTGEAVAFAPLAALEDLADVEGAPIGSVVVTPATVAADYVVTQEDAAQGTAAGHGTFVFEAEPGTATFAHSVPLLQDVPEAVALDLKGSAAAVTVALRLVDAEGETFTHDLGASSGTTWEQVYVEDPTSWTAEGGNADGLIDLPVTRLEVVVSDAVGGATGDLFIDDLRVIVPRTGPVIVEDFERLDFALHWDEELHSIAAGDLDGDGDADLVLSSEHLAAPVRLRLLIATAEPGAPEIAFGEAPSSAFGGAPELVARTLLHDYDGDDDLDLFAVGRDGQDRLFVNDGRAHFFDDTMALLPVDHATGVSIAAADLDLDGLDELVIANDGAVNRLYLSRGASGYLDVTPAMSLHTAPTLRLLPLDVDADGDLDLFELNQAPERSRLHVSVEPDEER